jgi:GT2 family glycosyltransferase
MSINISASLVLYNTPFEMYDRVINCFLNNSQGYLYIVDNSQCPVINLQSYGDRLIYIHSNKNIGFGAAHNLAFKLFAIESEFHIILNPDIYFENSPFGEISKFMISTPEVGALMPKILYPDRSIQHLAKLLPSPIILICRRFLIPIFPFLKRFNLHYELHGLSHSKYSEVPSISGCFLFLRTKAFKDINGFDERFFMYMEDVDLVRRISINSRVVYFPSVHVFHDYAKGSYKNFSLLIHHLYSAVLYFNKWGWFFDSYRTYVNSKILRKIKN